MNQTFDLDLVFEVLTLITKKLFFYESFDLGTFLQLQMFKDYSRLAFLFLLFCLAALLGSLIC